MPKGYMYIVIVITLGGPFVCMSQGFAFSCLFLPDVLKSSLKETFWIA